VLQPNTTPCTQVVTAKQGHGGKTYGSSASKAVKVKA